jgi:hypothetical protein
MEDEIKKQKQKSYGKPVERRRRKTIGSSWCYSPKDSQLQ